MEDNINKNKELKQMFPEDNLISLSEIKHEPSPYTEDQINKLRAFYVDGRVVYDEGIIKVLHGECKKEKKRNEYKR